MSQKFAQFSQIKYWEWQFISYQMPNILQKLADWNES